MKRLINILIVLFAWPVWALDTTEEYSHGFSDFEAYSFKNSTENAITLVAGYGHSSWVNPSLVVHNHAEASLGNFSHIYSNMVDIDLLAATSLNSETNHFSLGTEVTYPSVKFNPYLKGTLDFEGEEQLGTGVMGLSWNANSHIEMLTEISFDLSKGKRQHVAVGLNFKQSQSIELISEVGHSYEDEGAFASLGLIWTRN